MTVFEEINQNMGKLKMLSAERAFIPMHKLMWHKGLAFTRLTVAERNIIRVLASSGRGRYTVTELADKAGFSYPNLNKILKGLEDDGYIKREVNRENRRYIDVTITESGTEMIEVYLREGLAFVQKVYERYLTEEEIYKLNESLSYAASIYEKIGSELDLYAGETNDRKYENTVQDYDVV